uniref:Ras-GAP domain-containing protein n=1 Tax=Anas platyrhynchos TaxID=8839 RepID=A0A8B9SM84_ANAPL
MAMGWGCPRHGADGLRRCPQVLRAAPGADGERGDGAGPPASPVLPQGAAGHHQQVGPHLPPHHPRLLSGSSSSAWGSASQSTRSGWVQGPWSKPAVGLEGPWRLVSHHAMKVEVSLGGSKKGHCQKAGCAGAAPVCLVGSAPAYGAGPVGRSPGSRAPQAAPQHQGAEPWQGEVPPAPILRSHINMGLALVLVASPRIPSASIAMVPGGVLHQDGPSHILVWPQHAKFVAVTSFLCLRFFSPAIMTPKLFHLRDAHADARTSRTLLLLAKVGQGTAGDGRQRCHGGDATIPWSAGHPDGGQHGAGSGKGQGGLAGPTAARPAAGCQPDEGLHHPAGGDGGGGGRWRGEAAEPPAAVVKEGLLFVHKTRGKGPLLSCAAKKLHFCLTGEALSFAKSPGAEVRGAQEEVEAHHDWGGTEHRVPHLAEDRLHRPGQHPCRPRRWRRRASGAATSCRSSTWMRMGSRRRPTCSARWDGTGVGMGGVSQPGHPIFTPSPAAVRQRAEPVAVRPAQGVRQQPPAALHLPPRRLQGGQVDLLPPEGQDGYGGWPGCGVGVLVGCLHPPKNPSPALCPTGLGCDRTRHGVTLQDWSDPLDPDAEAQRLFQHLHGLQQPLR